MWCNNLTTFYRYLSYFIDISEVKKVAKAFTLQEVVITTTEENIFIVAINLTFQTKFEDSIYLFAKNVDMRNNLHTS